MTFNLLSLVHTKPDYKLTRLEFLVLLALKKKPLHGYGIMRRLTKKTPGVWKARSGSLYPLLGRMKKKGLVKSKARGDKKVYSLTRNGRKALNQYLKAWKELYALFREMSKA
jgi:DNA-binding PadR family transcriptional regulator